MELAGFIRQKTNGQWDQQIDADFSETGRLRSVMEEVREEIRAGKTRELPEPEKERP